MKKFQTIKKMYTQCTHIHKFSHTNAQYYGHIYTRGFQDHILLNCEKLGLPLHDNAHCTQFIQMTTSQVLHVHTCTHTHTTVHKTHKCLFRRQLCTCSKKKFASYSIMLFCLFILITNLVFQMVQ